MGLSTRMSYIFTPSWTHATAQLPSSLLLPLRFSSTRPKPDIVKTMPQNTQHAQDEVFMQQALKLATETIGLASPNPQVGCVLTQASPGGGTPKVIGEGAHLYANRDHAEIVALKQAAQRA